MRGKKAKLLTRIRWTRALNHYNWQEPVPTHRQFKKLYGKGIPLGLIIYYPRQGYPYKYMKEFKTEVSK